MSTKQEEQRSTQQNKQEEQRITQQKNQEFGMLEAVVRDNVLSKLGQPDDLHRVQVKCVWGNHYRVNVFVGPDAVQVAAGPSREVPPTLLSWFCRTNPFTIINLLAVTCIHSRLHVNRMIQKSTYWPSTREQLISSSFFSILRW